MSGALQISENDLSKCSIHLNFDLLLMLELNKKSTMQRVFLTANAIEVKSHQRVMITLSKEANNFFSLSGRARGRAALFSMMSASASGPRKNFSEHERERCSKN